MKVYVASSWREKTQPVVVEALRSWGHEVYDFRNPSSGDHGFHWSDIDPEWQLWSPEEYIEGLAHPVAESGFQKDFEAMKWADACVLVQPATPGRSSHLELGWCAGAGKLTIVLVYEGEPELMYKIADHVVTSLNDVLRILGGDQ